MNFFMELTEDAEDAKELVDELNDGADIRGNGCWNMGVTFDTGVDGERLLVIGREHDDTPEATIKGAMEIYLSLWTLRFATEKLMALVAQEAYLDDETLKALIPEEMETMNLSGVAPWEVPEV
jgi:hypothetical protein